MSLSCEKKHGAAPGKSDIGSTPFLEGVRSWVSHLETVLGGHLAFLGPALKAIAAAVLSPFAFFAWVTGFIGILLSFSLLVLYPLGAKINEASQGTNPLFVAALILLLLIRILCLPIALRGSRRAARMDAIQPTVNRLRSKYGKNHDGLSQALMRLYKEVDANPLSSCLPALFIVPLVGGFYSLLHGLTIRSDIGTYAPEHIPDGSGLYQYLNSSATLGNWGMDLTLSVPQVGACARLTPYLLSLAALAVLQWPLTSELRKRKTSYAVAFVAFTVLAALTLPVFFVLLRVGDAVFLLLQKFLMRKAQKHEFERLGNDPEFRTSVSELVTDFFPETGQHGSPAGSEGGHGRYGSPDDMNPHR